MSTEMRTLLRRLSTCSGISLAVISGRAIADLEMHVGIDGPFYVGNHGLELSGPGLSFQSPYASRSRGQLERALHYLVESTASLDGVFIEDKGASAAVHWRLASASSRHALRELIPGLIAMFPRLKISEGKCVWELRPKDGWNKGGALLNIAVRLGLSVEDVIYLGDDLTDEDAFRAIPHGVTFRVGTEPTQTVARYTVHDPHDVASFFRSVLSVRLHGSASHQTVAPSSFASLETISVD